MIYHQSQPNIITYVFYEGGRVTGKEVVYDDDEYYLIKKEFYNANGNLTETKYY